jgi:hypothetical protein
VRKAREWKSFIRFLSFWHPFRHIKIAQMHDQFRHGFPDVGLMQLIFV